MIIPPGNGKTAAGIAAATIIIVYLLFPSTVPAQGTGPTVKIAATVRNCSQFEEIQVHPSRYVLSKAQASPFNPVIYDIETRRLISLPALDTLPGLPRPAKITATGSNAAYERSRLTLQGNYWSWSDKKVVFFDAASGRAGIYLSQFKPVKFVSGAPLCRSCGGASRYIEQYGRYYCDACRKYVDEKDYIRNTYVSFYGEMDPASGRLLWITELERDWKAPGEAEGIRVIGVDPGGNHLYYCNNIYFYNSTRTTGHIIVHRFNIASRSVDWKYEIKIPVREKEKAPSYAVNPVHSPDFRHIYFWEYDEGWPEHPAKGYLSNPGPTGWVVDTAARSHFSFPVPVTPYGSAFSRDGKYLVIGSNQTGAIHKISLEKKVEAQRVQASGAIFKFIFTPASRYLLSFTKTGAEVFTWPELKKMKTIPMGSIIPGVQQLLVSEPMYGSADGKYGVLSILEKADNGPWWSGKRDDGFYLMEIGD